MEGELRAEFAFMEDALDAVDDEDGELVIEAGVGVALSLLFPSLDVAAVVAEFVGVETGVVVAGTATARRCRCRCRGSCRCRGGGC